LGADLQAAATLYTQITGQAVTADALTPLMFDFLNHAPISEIRTWVGFSGQENQIIQNSYQQLFGNAITADVLNTLKLALVAGTTTMASVQAAFKAQAAADVPVISNVVASQDALANSFVFPLGAITVADSDPGAIETATVSLNGSGRLITGTTVVAAPNIYTIKGTASNVTAYLRGLNFAPPTGAATTWLSLTVQNGAGNTTTTKLAINTETMRSPVQTAFLYAPAQNVSLALYPAETVVFGATGFGTDTLTGFSITQGVIELPRTIAASFATVQAHEAATAGGTLISFSPSESILISGIAPSSLHASNFNIV
jgi:hypothetical protein